ncbi:hypothetical protein [Oricola cellulosilytica]|uniref:Uncharacterized protein n=1 Tax=Oricola cellulosilytica TaxID=1429082 RepID=A0A4R0P8L9_9HYPH|nr:hypothetical protein [Oricola cellulosilytica]TCD13423.1 hypothetical protein E0D97_13150 [Oricola cellulosilytica]
MCRIIRDGDGALRTAVEAARSDWLIVLEPGARLRAGWAEAVIDHVAKPDAGAACFRPPVSGHLFHRWLARLITRRRALARGLVISRHHALAKCGPGRQSGEDLARGIPVRHLAAWIEPPVA